MPDIPTLKLTTPSPAAAATDAAIARFKLWHASIKRDALSLKLRSYFAGLEIQHLRSHFEAIHGPIQRGGKPDAKPLVTFQQWLEENLEITARTARRYHTQFTSISTHFPKHADKLNHWWQNMLQPLMLNDNGSSDEAQNFVNLATRNAHADLPAEGLQDILAHADEWDLHDLLEVPIKEARGSHKTVGEDPQPGDPKHREHQLLIDFWTSTFPRRLERDEILRLPKPEREAIAARLEETLTKLKATL